MSAEKEPNKLFKGILVAEHVVGKIQMKLFSNAIFYVKIPKHETITIDFTVHGYAFLDDNGGGSFLNIYHFDDFADVQGDVRRWAADPNKNNYTLCDALVVSGPGQKIMADFYIKFNHPSRPTRVFYRLEDAIAWVLAHQKNLGRGINP